MTDLFQTGSFWLHSGRESCFKIECDAISRREWENLAFVATRLFGRPGAVEGVPTGGLPFAAAFRPFLLVGGPLWIVDDVLTTGGSMEEHRAGRQALGVVLFARSAPPTWIKALFTMTNGCP